MKEDFYYSTLLLQGDEKWSSEILFANVLDALAISCDEHKEELERMIFEKFIEGDKSNGPKHDGDLTVSYVIPNGAMRFCLLIFEKNLQSANIKHVKELERIDEHKEEFEGVTSLPKGNKSA
ncbi:hypothetical protein AMTR_s00057p00209920 [Amborella trichopoda]|uniref:Uncharacterized protein n=1 Tax=Amborella trichopoda TaxID=13333 RepID=U5D6E5_AMBTC|nr:hypothetical protein AMTR_s00057p00209920 [Amborella trichopoda]